MSDSSVDVMDGFGHFIRIHHIYGKQIALETFLGFFFFFIISSIKSVKLAGRKTKAVVSEISARKQGSLTFLTSGWKSRERESAAGACACFTSTVIHARYA